MKLSKLATITLAALLVTAGAAVAMPGNAPNHAGADEHEQTSDPRPDDVDDAREDNDTDAGENATDVDENADARAVNESDTMDDGDATETDDEHTSNARAFSAAASNQRAAQAQGPPSDMSEQVPDHVLEIHQLIADFLSGGLD